MLSRIRPLDAAILIIAVLVIVAGGVLGYSIWSNGRDMRTSSPANREIEALKQKLKQKPNDVETRMRLAQAYSVAGRPQESVAQYKAVLKLNKDWVPALSGIGFELMKQEDWKGGEEYFKRVIELTEGKTPILSGSSSLEVAYYYTGIARMEQKDYSGAAGYLKAALRSRQTSSDTAYALAVCYEKLGIVQGHKEMLEYALRFDPKMPEANYDYGLLLLSEGKTAQAAEHFRISTTMAPYKEEPKAELKKLGNGADRLKAANSLASTDASAALSEARIAAALEPASVEPVLLVAQLYEKLKKKTLASEAYEKVLTLDPGNSDATAGLKRVKNGS
ncbi:MAG: tetratricopeptide repeat protein [Coriobacteriia bacterium]|nr:tetratricopeptide repeat protein [Coriobacteriia bacterium]